MLETTINSELILNKMPRKPCYWTRKLELDLVKYVRDREFIWKPIGNTNHHIEQKYKAYAEFAKQLGQGFTARSIRDRWVNIRSTFNHNLRRIDKSRETARTTEDIYVPCWPLWKPLQFLREVYKKEGDHFNNEPPAQLEPRYLDTTVKDETNTNIDVDLNIRQQFRRTDRPRHRTHKDSKVLRKNNKCQQVLDNLIKAMAPLVNHNDRPDHEPFWFFGRHVTEQLNAMNTRDAESASNEIYNILDSFSDGMEEQHLNYDK